MRKPRKKDNQDLQNAPSSDQPLSVPEGDIDTDIREANKQLNGSLSASLKPKPIEAESQAEHLELQYTPSKRKRRKYRADSGSLNRDGSADILQAESADASFVGEQQRFRIEEPSGTSDQILEQPSPIEKQRSLPDTIEAAGSARARSDIENIDHLHTEPPSEMARKPRQNPIPTTTPTSTPRKRGRPRKDQSAGTPRDKTDANSVFKKLPDKDKILDDQASVGNRRGKRTRAEPDPSSISSTAKERQNLSNAPENEVSPSQTENERPTRDDLSDEDQNLENVTSEFYQLIQKGDSDSLMRLKAQILEGLTGKRRLPLVNLDQEYQKVHQLVEQTVLAGEGNSALIIGSRGTAKTTLVETVIADLAFDHRDVFHVVRLNGFIHTDDKLALREIWRQLGREMEIEDDSMSGRSNYADTLTSLLALLSHSAEADGVADQTAKSVIFILDEFDLFASHPRQTLLYNLFDVAQSRNAPIIVLGLTTKVDVVETLEKRVKSRFGQRYIHLPLPRSLNSFHTICKSALIPPVTISTRFNPATADFHKLHAAWTTYIDALFSHDQTLLNFLQTLYTRSKSIPDFLTASLLPISLLSPTTLPTGENFTSTPLLPPDSKLHLLPSLSDSALALLIAAARLDILLDADTCTFGMAHDEYVQLATKVKIASSAAGQAAVGAAARVWGRDVAREAWERLAALELVLPVSAGRAGGMWRVDVALEEIAPSVPGLDAVMVRWCKEL